MQSANQYSASSSMQAGASTAPETPWFDAHFGRLGDEGDRLSDCVNLLEENLARITGYRDPIGKPADEVQMPSASLDKIAERMQRISSLLDRLESVRLGFSRLG